MTFSQRRSARMQMHNIILPGTRAARAGRPGGEHFREVGFSPGRRTCARKIKRSRIGRGQLGLDSVCIQRTRWPFRDAIAGPARAAAPPDSRATSRIPFVYSRTSFRPLFILHIPIYFCVSDTEREGNAHPDPLRP